nr:hypothetical protein [Bradyrhizobium diversitatis]
MVAARRLVRLVKDVLQIALPRGRILAAAQPLYLGCVQDALNAPPEFFRRLLFRAPERAHSRQHVMDVDVRKRLVAHRLDVVGQRVPPAGLGLGAPPPPGLHGGVYVGVGILAERHHTGRHFGRLDRLNGPVGDWINAAPEQGAGCFGPLARLSEPHSVQRPDTHFPALAAEAVV